jgi:hypothetical protein
MSDPTRKQSGEMIFEETASYNPFELKSNSDVVIMGS